MKFRFTIQPSFHVRSWSIHHQRVFSRTGWLYGQKEREYFRVACVLEALQNGVKELSWGDDSRDRVYNAKRVCVELEYKE